MYGWFDAPLAVDALSVLTCSFDPQPGALLRSPDRRPGGRALARTEPTDPSQAEALAATIDREVTDQAPWVPLFTPQTVVVTSARVGNVQAERGHLLIDQLLGAVVGRVDTMADASSVGVANRWCHSPRKRADLAARGLSVLLRQGVPQGRFPARARLTVDS